MAKKILIQPGHINIKNNCIASLRSSTGAPGEQELTLRIANRLSEKLRQKGFEVKQTDANGNCDKDVTEKDWDLALAVHGDADAAGISGGVVGYPEPSTDGATNESQRIATAIREEYFPHSGIDNVPGKFSNNIKFYYMWKSLTGPTPCVLIELGEVQDPHDKVILADTERVVNAVLRGICKAFNVPFDDVTPPVDWKQKFDALTEEYRLHKEAKQKEIDALNDKIRRGREALA